MDPLRAKIHGIQRHIATITLEQLALPATGNYKMAKIPIGGSSTHFYTVEARRLVGYDIKLPGAAVIIHEVDTTREEPAHVVGGDGSAGAMWVVGETFTDTPNKISVTVLSATATGFQVSISLNAASASPTVTTGKATNVAMGSATLNGTVNPNGASTTYYFEWGLTSSYGNTTSAQSAGSGTSNVAVSADLTGLTPETAYHYRLVATNSVGTSYGVHRTFGKSNALPFLMLLLD